VAEGGGSAKPGDAASGVDRKSMKEIAVEAKKTGVLAQQKLSQRTVMHFKS
jgi:hypothetical protein